MPVTGRSHWDEGLTIRVRWDPEQEHFRGYVLVTSGAWDQGGYHELIASPHPDHLYEEIMQEVGMWGVNFVERLREAATLF